MFNLFLCLWSFFLFKVVIYVYCLLALVKINNFAIIYNSWFNIETIFKDAYMLVSHRTWMLGIREIYKWWRYIIRVRVVFLFEEILIFPLLFFFEFGMSQSFRIFNFLLLFSDPVDIFLLNDRNTLWLFLDLWVIFLFWLQCYSLRLWVLFLLFNLNIIWLKLWLILSRKTSSCSHNSYNGLIWRTPIITNKRRLGVFIWQNWAISCRNFTSQIEWLLKCLI